MMKMYQPAYLAEVLHRKGMPAYVKNILVLANLVNQHIGSTRPGGSESGLMFLVCCRMLWLCLQQLSDFVTDKKMATDKKDQVRRALRGVVAHRSRL
jgi:hypothetical protein